MGARPSSEVKVAHSGAAASNVAAPAASARRPEYPPGTSMMDIPHDVSTVCTRGMEGAWEDDADVCMSSVGVVVCLCRLSVRFVSRCLSDRPRSHAVIRSACHALLACPPAPCAGKASTTSLRWDEGRRRTHGREC